jgi:asparagine synthase (glutamine-hydrolysing)
MCGINAIFAWHPSAPPLRAEELLRTREAMRARGPDAAGSWISPDGRVGLGHRRLSIVYRAIVPRTPRFSPKSAALPQYGCTWEGAYLVKRGLFLPEELPAIVGDEAAREGLRRLDPLRRIRDVLTPDPGHPFARVAALESELFLRNQLLRDLDWCSMAHGLEVRVPLVDHLLLQRLAPLVLEGGGKDLLARAPRQSLPPEVLQRPKTGFTIPARQWLDIRPARVNIHPFGRRNWALYLLDAV